jgi:hypothetical protein
MFQLILDVLVNQHRRAAEGGRVAVPITVADVLAGVDRQVSSDEFSLRYSDLVRGSYDCVDRIVLNVFFPLGHNPGGFRVWRRRHDDSNAELDNTHLMRLAGRFARRVKAWGAANGGAGHLLYGR